MSTQVSMTLEQLCEKALQLPLHERIQLAETLFDSAESEDANEDPAEVEAAWAEEIKHRVEEFDAGTAESSPVRDVFARVSARLKRISNAQVQPR